MIHHLSPISGIATHGDQYVATAGYDNLVILWDAKTKIALTRSVHDHLANQCSFSPDGKYLASASSDYSARLWSVPELKLEAVFNDHRDDVEMITFHPSRPLVATASRDHHVRVFDLDGRLVRRFSGHTADVLSVAWANHPSQLISAGDDCTVRRWNIDTGEMIENVDMHGVETDTIAQSPEGVIFAGNDEGVIAVLKNGEISRIDAHRAGIKRVVFDAASRRLLSISYDRTFKLWSVAPSGELSLLESDGLPELVWARSSAFLGHTRLVFGTFGTSYATYDLAARRMDLSGVEPTWGMNAAAVFNGKIYSIGDAGVLFADGVKVRELGSLCNFLTPFGPFLLTGGQMGVLFDGITGRTIHQHRSPLNCAAVFTEGGVERAVVGAYTGEGLVFRIGGGGIELEREIQLHENAIKGVAAARGMIFSVCATGAAAFHSTHDYEALRRVPRAHDKIANGCAALPGDPGVFVSVSRDLMLRIWGDGGEEKLATPARRSIKCVAASASGRYAAIGTYDGNVAVLEVATRRFIHAERPTACGISSLAADRDEFVASSYDGSVYRITRHTAVSQTLAAGHLY